MCSCALFLSVVTMNAQCICRWLLAGGLPLVLPSACLFFRFIFGTRNGFCLLENFYMLHAVELMAVASFLFNRQPLSITAQLRAVADFRLPYGFLHTTRVPLQR